MSNEQEIINMGSDSTVIGTEIKLRTNIKLGKRVLSRVAKVIDITRMGEYTDDSLRVISYICADINYPNPEHTRSQKVMAYRKANKLIDLIAKFSQIAGPDSINSVSQQIVFRLSDSPPVIDMRLLAVELINSQDLA